MALASAAVLGLMNYANRRRAPNCRRVACRTTESDLTSSRLLAKWHTTFSRRLETGGWLHNRCRWSLV